MASPLGKRVESQPSNLSYERILTQFQGEWVERLNIEQMFILIDGVLPFEACLYHQVLPLFLEGSRLNLGMVSTNDTAALDYVRRIISYLNYSLIPRSISSEAHQSVLTAYLNHTGGKQAGAEPRPESRPQTPAPSRHHRPSARFRAEQHIDPNTQQTYIVDSPEDLNDLPVPPVDAPGPVTPPPQIPFTPVEPPPPAPSTDAEFQNLDYSLYVEADSQFNKDLLRSDVNSANSAKPDTPSAQTTNQPPPQVPPASTHLPVLDVQPKHLSSSIEVLATLPPYDLLQELLGRVLLGGIGRLYFERQSGHGRVLWSQNGVLQSVLDKLNPAVFQGLINELKRMTHLSMIPIEKPRDIEIERQYQSTRLLLRFRFIPTEHGEEATVQVLRGAALKFYQRQQITNLERDALTIAKQLQFKLSEIRDRARSEPSLTGAKLDVLPALSQLLRRIEHQLDDLGVDLNNQHD